MPSNTLNLPFISFRFSEGLYDPPQWHVGARLSSLEVWHFVHMTYVRQLFSYGLGREAYILSLIR
jgi:hypothetical protein